MRYKIQVTDTETGEVHEAECGHDEVYFIMTGKAYLDSYQAHGSGTLQAVFKDVNTREMMRP